MAQNNSTNSNLKIAKLPSELSEEELLKALESEEEIIPQAPNNVVAFLLFYNITPGAFPVKSSVLYKLYTKHTKEPIGNFKFSVEAGKYIPHVNSYFNINMSAFKIADKTFQLISKTKQNATSPRYRRHFENFLKANNLEDGNIFVNLDDLYEEYQKWCYSIKRRRNMGKAIFGQLLKLYIKKEKLVKGKKYYSIELERASKGDFYRAVCSKANTHIKMKYYDKTTKNCTYF